LAGHQFYSIVPGNIISDSEKTISHEKFGEKVLIWQAICQCGDRSAPFSPKEQ